MGLRFLSLASGSSGNCYYIGNGKHGILIDAGIGIRTIKKVLKENHIPLESILGLCISHDHADHIKSAGVLGEKYNIPVYTTKEVIVGMNKRYTMTEKVVQSGRPIVKDVPFQVGEFTITAFEVPHDGTDNVGYFVECGHHTFAVVTDLGHIPPHVASYLSRANYLLIEANYDEEMLMYGSYPIHLKQRIAQPYGHLSNKVTADFLASIYAPHLSHIFLCHLSRENNHPELAFKTVEFRLRLDNILVGRDVELVSLKRRTPSELYLLG